MRRGSVHEWFCGCKPLGVKGTNVYVGMPFDLTVMVVSVQVTLSGTNFSTTAGATTPFQVMTS